MGRGEASNGCRRTSSPQHEHDVRKATNANSWMGAQTRLGATILAICATLQLSSAHAQEEEYASARSTVGYVDAALPVNLFRLRFDAGYDDNTPDRGEFFYSQYRQQAFTPIAGPASGSGKGGSGRAGEAPAPTVKGSRPSLMAAAGGT